MTTASVRPTSRPSERDDRRRAHRAVGLALAVAALFTAGGGTVLAITADRSDGAVSAEPSTVAAGGTIVVAASGLRPWSGRLIVLAAQDLVVELGSVSTDAAGMFRQEFVIPSHLPPESYELRVIGDETLMTRVTVVASVATTGVGQAADGESIAVTSIILAAAGFVVAAAGVVARRAERVDRLLRARSP